MWCFLVMTLCVKCGKKLGFFEPKKNITEFPSIEDYDKDLRGLEATKREKTFCESCFKQYIKELEAKKQCVNCAHTKIIEEYDFNLEAYYSHYQCKKLDEKLNPTLIIKEGENITLFFPAKTTEFYFLAEKCVHYIDKEKYREKLLKGELDEKARLVICQYCDTQFDANQNLHCPKCGA